jgi:hypothetical protein
VTAKETLMMSCMNARCRKSRRKRTAVTAVTGKSWEIIADNLSKAGWSWGCVSAINSYGQTIWIVDAHRDNGRRFIVHADEKLSAFVELQRAIHKFAVSLIL